jgi:membrane protein implicated in regulation of membrane protease activity
MKSTNFALQIAGIIFFLVAILHLLRIITKVPILVSGWLIPIWVNWMGFVVTGLLSVWFWWISRHKKDESAFYLKDRNRYN